MVDLCPWCRADLRFHCRADCECTWAVCTEPACGVTIDLAELRAIDKTGKRIELPHTQPDAE